MTNNGSRPEASAELWNLTVMVTRYRPDPGAPGEYLRTKMKGGVDLPEVDPAERIPRVAAELAARYVDMINKEVEAT